MGLGRRRVEQDGRSFAAPLALERKGDEVAEPLSGRLSGRRLAPVQPSVTGNQVEIVETNESSVARFLKSHETLWADIVRDGVVVYGKSLDGLRGRQSA